MKRSESKLISAFLSAVRKGGISADDGWKPGLDPGPNAEALRMIEVAFSRILQGESAEIALEVERLGGTPSDPFLPYLKIEIRNWRLAGEKWEVVKEYADAWLKKRGRPVVSMARLKQLLKEHKHEISPLTLEEAADIDAWAKSCRKF